MVICIHKFVYVELKNTVPFTNLHLSVWTRLRIKIQSSKAKSQRFVTKTRYSQVFENGNFKCFQSLSDWNLQKYKARNVSSLLTPK